MQDTTTDSTTQTQAGEQNAREKINVEGIPSPDLFEQDVNAGHSEKPSDQSEIEVPDIDPVNPVYPAFTPTVEDQLLTDFKKDVAEIKAAGVGLIAATGKFEAKCKNAAVGVLAKIFGIKLKYFANAPEGTVKLLMEELRKITNLNVNKNTTVYHLLSRYYRGSDRQKASADAKVLMAAEEYQLFEVTESTFATWLQSMGGYDAVVKNSSKTTISNAPSKRIPKSEGERKALYKKAREIALTLNAAGQMKHVFSIPEDSMPEMTNALKADYANKFNLIAVQIVDGQLVFGKFYPYLENPIKSGIPQLGEDD